MKVRITGGLVFLEILSGAKNSARTIRDALRDKYECKNSGEPEDFLIVRTGDSISKEVAVSR